MRTVAIFSTMSPIIAAIALAVAGHEPPRAAACSPIAPHFPTAARAAQLVALVEVTAPFGPENRAPTVTPTVTATFTSTPRPSATAAFFRTTSPEAEPSPTEIPPSVPQRLPYDLTGIGATVRVLTIYAGTAPAVIEIDRQTRATTEQGAREYEALPPGIISSCPLDLGVSRFEAGRQYLIFADASGDNVDSAYRIAGAGVDAYLDGQHLFVMPRALATKHLLGVNVQDYNDDGEVVLVASNIPLGTMLGIVAELRGDATIRPPATGSGGLRGGR